MAGLRVMKCPRCGNIFTKDRHPICPACWRKEQEDLDKVRRHLDENPGATALEVSAGTGVPEPTVIRFIKEGHLIVAQGHGVRYPCETCGKPIATGRFCPDCGERLTKGLESEIRKVRGRKRDDYGWKKTGETKVIKTDEG
jgi:predicted amidophosphoribosyltransferase